MSRSLENQGRPANPHAFGLRGNDQVMTTEATPLAEVRVQPDPEHVATSLNQSDGDSRVEIGPTVVVAGHEFQVAVDVFRTGPSPNLAKKPPGFSRGVHDIHGSVLLESQDR